MEREEKALELALWVIFCGRYCAAICILLLKENNKGDREMINKNQ